MTNFAAGEAAASSSLEPRSPSGKQIPIEEELIMMRIDHHEKDLKTMIVDWITTCQGCCSASP
jgi:hypothetical protein